MQRRRGETATHVPTVQAPIHLAQDLRAVLPIGIPLGWQPHVSSDERYFAVRRGGRFCYMNPEGQELWASSWQGLARQQLVQVMAAKRKCNPEEVLKDLDQMLASRLLLQLGGDWREDWERIASIRVLPRAFVADCDEKSRFRLVTPDGRHQVWLSAADYVVWAAWDGTSELRKAVRSASEASGFAESTLRQRAHSLLVAAARGGAVFLDETLP